MISDTEVTITSSASSRVKFLTSQDGTKFMRIAVEGGGCNGFQYNYTFENDTNPEDVVFSKEDACIVIDALSLEYIKSATIDYVETLGFASFEIKNPNSSTRCGCGNSFAL